MPFNFCPNCGARLPPSDDGFAPQGCAQCGRTQYHNSKPCAGALIVKENRVLLVLRAVEPFKGCWDIPGGFLEAGEHPYDGMLREVKEETGLEIEIIDEQPVAVLKSDYADIYFGFYRAKCKNTEVKIERREIEDFGWFTVEEINKLNLMNATKIFYEKHLNESKQKVIK
jgi:NADH pyrophosphatase NudC (nudix superfamily)